MYISEIRTSNIERYGTIDYYKKLFYKDIPYMMELTKEIFRMLQYMFDIKFNEQLKLELDTNTNKVEIDYNFHSMDEFLDMLINGFNVSGVLGQFNYTNNTITIFLYMHQYKAVNQLIYTICHEIAHIKEMNHNKEHTRLTWQFKNLVKTGLINNKYIKSKYKEKSNNFSEIFKI